MEQVGLQLIYLALGLDDLTANVGPLLAEALI